MNLPKKDKNTRQFTGKHFLIFIVSFFVVIIAANGMMAYFAIDTFSGLETEDAYRKGRDYNQTLDAARKQAELGWQEKVTVEKIGLGERSAHKISVNVRGAEAESRLKAAILFKRPATNAEDRLIPLVMIEGGQFEGVTDALLPGKWKYVLVIKDDDRDIFRKNGEMIIGDE